MPKGFDACVKKKGSRVRTIKLKNGKYRHVCYYKGKSYLGHVKTKKDK